MPVHFFPDYREHLLHVGSLMLFLRSRLGSPQQELMSPNSLEKLGDETKFKEQMGKVEDATPAAPEPSLEHLTKRQKVPILEPDPEGRLYVRKSALTLNARVLKISHERTPNLVGHFVGGPAEVLQRQLVADGKVQDASQVALNPDLALSWRSQLGIHVVYAEDEEGNEQPVRATLQLKAGWTYYIGCPDCCGCTHVEKCSCTYAFGDLVKSSHNFALDEFRVPPHLHNYSWGPSKLTECSGTLNLNHFVPVTLVGYVS